MQCTKLHLHTAKRSRGTCYGDGKGEGDHEIKGYSLCNLKELTNQKLYILSLVPTYCSYGLKMSQKLETQRPYNFSKIFGVFHGFVFSFKYL